MPLVPVTSPTRWTFHGPGSYAEVLGRLAVGMVVRDDHDRARRHRPHALGERHADDDLVRRDALQVVTADEVEVTRHQPLARRADGRRRIRQVLPDRLAAGDHGHLQPGGEQRIGHGDRLERAGVVEDDGRVLEPRPTAEAEHVPRREHVRQVEARDGSDRSRQLESVATR